MSEAITKALQDVIAAHDHGLAIMGEQMRDAGVTALTIGGPEGDAALMMFEAISAARAALSQPPPAPQPAPVDELPDLNPEDFVVAVVFKQLGGFAPVTAHGVRVTHKPSRISVVVDSERSQHKNRQLALQALRSIISEEFKS